MAKGVRNCVVRFENGHGHDVNYKQNWTIPELISYLQSAFKSADFDEAEAILVAREEKLTYQIEGDRLERLGIERELENYKRQCLELREANCRLWEERKGSSLVMQDAKKGGRADGDDGVAELKEKICELESAKLRAEAEVEVWKRRFEELETRVSRLEEDTVMLKMVEPKLEVDCGVSGRLMEDKSEDGKIESEKTKLVQSVGQGGENFANLRNVNAINGEENVHMEEKCRVHSGVADKLTEEKRVIGGQGKVAEKSSVKSGNVQTKLNVIGVNDDFIVREGVGSTCLPAVQANRNMPSEGGGQQPSKEIVDISDSDDDHSFRRNLSVKEIMAQTPAESAHSGQAGLENGTKMLKRKQAPCMQLGQNVENDEVVDVNSKTNKQKLGHVQLMVGEPSGSPINHGSATAVSSVSNSIEKFSSPRQGHVILRQCEETTRAENKSERHINDLILSHLACLDSEDSSSSSDSDSDDDADMDFNFSQFLPKQQGSPEKKM